MCLIRRLKAAPPEVSRYMCHMRVSLKPYSEEGVLRIILERRPQPGGKLKVPHLQQHVVQVH